MNNKRVTVRLDDKGGFAGVEVEGQVDPEDRVEEIPGKPAPSPADDGPRNLRFWKTD